MKYSHEARQAIQNRSLIRHLTRFIEEAGGIEAAAALAASGGPEVDMIDRILKPRHGRLASNSRSNSDQNTASGHHQPGQPPFSNVDPNIVNGTSAQQNGLSFGQPSGSLASSSTNNGQPSFQSSFGSGFGTANSGFNQTPLAPPTSNFNFSLGSTAQFANPFSASDSNTQNPTTSTAKTSTLFQIPSNTPAQKQTQQGAPPFQPTMLSGPDWKYTKVTRDSGDDAPLWASHAPFSAPDGQSAGTTATIDALFGTTQTRQPPGSDNFGGTSNQQSSQPLSKSFGQPFGTPQQSASSSVFGSFSQQPTETQNSVFGHRSTPQAQQQQHNSQTSPNSDNMSTSPDNSPQRTDGVKQNSHAFAAQPQANHNSGIADPPQVSSLFAGVTIPESASSIAPTPGQGGLFGRVTEPEVATTTNTASGQGISLFERISDPQTDRQAAVPGHQQVPSSNKVANSAESIKSSIQERKIATPTFTMPPASNNKAATTNPFSKLDIPAFSPIAPTSTTAPYSAATTPYPSQADSRVGNMVNGTGPSATIANSSTLSSYTSLSKDQAMTMMPPTIPDKFAEPQRRRYITEYRLRSLDNGLKKHILNAPSFSGDSEAMRFYQEKKQEILGANGLPLIVPGIKRKSIDDGRNNDSNAQSKHVSFNGPITNGDGAKRPLFSHQPPSGKRKADEDIGKESINGTNDASKKARGDDDVLYPSLPSSQGSQTSHIFASIVNGTGNAEVGKTSKPTAPTLAASNFSVPKPMFQQLSPQKSFTTPGPDMGSNMQPPPTASVPNMFSVKPNTLTAANSLSSKSSITDTSSAFSAAPSTGMASASLFAKSSTGNPSNPFASKTSSDNAEPLTIAEPLTVAEPLTIAEPPVFGTGKGKGSAVEMTAQFGKIAGKNMEDHMLNEKTKRKAEDFDSEEDNPEEFGRKYEEEQRAKKQKIDVSRKGKKTVPGKGFVIAEEGREQGQEKVNEDLATPYTASIASPLFQIDSAKHMPAPSGGLFGSTTQATFPSTGNSVFSTLKPTAATAASGGHIFRAASPTPSQSGPEGSKTGDADDEDASSGEESEGHDEEHNTEDNDSHETVFSSSVAPQASLETHSVPVDSTKVESFAGSHKAPDTLSVENVEEAPKSTGRSIFDRIGVDEYGNPLREVAPPEENKADGKFDKTFATQTGSSSPSIWGGEGKKAASKFGNLSAQVNILGSSSPNTGGSGSFSQLSSSQTSSNLFSQPTSSDTLFGKASSPQTSNNVFGQTSSKENTSIFGSSQNSNTSFGQPSTSNGSGLFGRITSPSSGSALFGSSTSPANDHTWKQDSPIKFGASSSAPSVSVTAATPTKSNSPDQKTSPSAALTGLFGAPKLGASETPTKSSSNIFGATNTASPADVGFVFGAPPKPTSNLLAAPSAANSTTTSRASSPGVTTAGESANESTAEGGDDGAAHQQQIDLMASSPGEEDEDILFQVRAKGAALGLKPKKNKTDPDEKAWFPRGIGPLRVLKHRETGKTRIILRVDPAGRIVLNSALMSGLKYEQYRERYVKMAVATDAGKLESWTILLKTKDDAATLARILEENKSN